jgi:hypothetical protein
MVVTKVVPFAPAVFRRDISWRFKPLFIWMRIFGIELDPVFNPLHQITYFYGLLFLFICQWASISFTVEKNSLKFSLPVNASNFPKSATLGWNVKIDMINNFTLMTVVCPAYFYIAHNQRWLRLLDAMKTFNLTFCQFNRGKIGRNFLFFIGFVPILSVYKKWPALSCALSVFLYLLDLS